MTEDLKPIRSGHCNLSNPPEIHAQCDGDVQGHPCSCDHHLEVEPAVTVVYDLPEDDYHGLPSLSASRLKTLDDLSLSPAEVRYELDHRKEKAAYDFGHAAHLKVLGKGNELAVIDASDWRTKAAQEARKAAYAEGRVPLLTKDVAQVDAMAKAIEDHDAALDALTAPGNAEVSAFATDPDTGIDLRSRADYLHRDGTCVDYKTSANGVGPFDFAKTAAKFGYDIQAATYRHVFGLAGQPLGRFLFVVQAKEPPYAVAVYELDERSEDVGAALMRRAIDRYIALDAAGWPGWEGIRTISTPTWRLNQGELSPITIPTDFEWKPGHD